MIVNPFEQVRAKLNITSKELSTALNVSYLTIEQSEKGLIKKPARYAKALEEAGLIDSASNLLVDHQSWLAKLQKEKLRELKSRIF